MSTSVNIFRNTHSSSSSGGGKEEETKSVTITENGTTTITPDEGKTLASVNVTTSVNPVAKGLYWKYTDIEDEWNEGEFLEKFGGGWVCSINNDSDKLIVVTTDENEPEDGGSNILMSMSVEAGSTATIKMRFEIDEEIVIMEIRILTIIKPI